MASRLSNDGLIKSYDKGLQKFSQILASRASKEETVLQVLDLKKTIQDPNCKSIIKKTAPQTLFLTLVSYGPEDCLEILPYITKKQFIRIFDYSVWEDGDLAPEKAFKWLAYYHEIDPQQMLARFQSLDSEYQIALFAPFVRIYDKEAFESMPDEMQDSLNHFPGNELYYEVNTDSEEIYNGVQNILNAAFAHHMAYAMTLVGQAAFSQPLEAAYLLKQFRDARLEEDGFVTYDEAREIFLPLRKTELSKWSDLPPSQDIIALSQELYFDLILRESLKSDPKLAENIQRELAYLGNALCAATHTEASDLSEIKQLLLLAKHFLSFALSHLSQNNIHKAQKILQEERLKTLFRAGITAVHSLRQEILPFLRVLTKDTSKKAEELYYAQKYGRLLDWMDQNLLDVLSFEETEVLKGIFNRFPLIVKEISPGQLQILALASSADFSQLAKQVHDIIQKGRP